MNDTNAQSKANRNLDPEELTAIFDQFAPPLYRYTLRLCHDPSLSDNIVGDVFAQLLEEIVSGKGRPIDLRSYLYQTAYHSAVQKLREQRDHTGASPVDAALKKTSFSAPHSDERAKRESLLSALHNELTEEQRHLMRLLFLEDFSLDDTAKILGRQADALLADLRDIQRLIDKHPELQMDLSLILKRKKRKPR